MYPPDLSIIEIDSENDFNAIKEVNNKLIFVIGAFTVVKIAEYQIGNPQQFSKNMLYVKIILYEKLIERRAPRHLHFKICVLPADWTKYFRPLFSEYADVISLDEQCIYGNDYEIKKNM